MILKGISAVQNLTITLKDVRIHASDTQAFVTCVECMEGVNTTGWYATILTLTWHVPLYRQLCSTASFRLPACINVLH